MKLVSFITPGSSQKQPIAARTGCVTRMLLMLLSVALPVMVQAQFNFTANNGTITITGYTGPGGAVTIPDTINGLPVASIGSCAFSNRTTLTSVTIGTNITSVGDGAFWA